jgi:hypothetical protein
MSTSTTYTINGTLNGTLYTNQDLTQVETDAMVAYNAYKNMTPSTTFATWNSSLTITGVNGLNVLTVTDINLSSSQVVTLQGGPNASFVVNVTGGFTMGGSARITGGGSVNGSKIFINVVGNGSTVSSHIGNFIDGTVLAPNRAVSLHNVTGQVIAGGASLTAMSGGTNNFNGYKPPKGNFATVGQFMFKDNNLNGKKDAGDTSVANGTVILYDSLNNILGTRITDFRGFYLFDSIPMPDKGPVNFRIRFINPEAGYSFVSAFAPGSDSTNQSVADPLTGLSPLFSLKAGQIKLTINSGIKNGGTLPVKLLSFSVTLVNGKAEINWVTASETNLSHFIVEKSYDGIHFNEAGTVFAKGNTTDNTNYNFSDDLNSFQSGVIYYRLLSVDKDGKGSYSETRIIRMSRQDNNNIRIQAYPNPVTNELHISIPSEWQNKKVIYEVLNANGQVSKKTETNNSSQTETVNMSTLPPGFYIIRVSCEGQTRQQKIVRQ